MSSFERKMKRNALRAGHKKLRQDWKKENQRRAEGVYVPVTSTDLNSPTNTLPNESTDSVPIVPNVRSQRLPMLGRPPSLGQFGKLLEKFEEQKKAVAAKQKEDFLKRREEEEKKADLEWKDEP